MRVQEVRPEARAGWYRVFLTPLRSHGDQLRDKAVLVLSSGRPASQGGAGQQGRGRQGPGSRGLRQAAALNSSRPLVAPQETEQQQQAKRQKLAQMGYDADALGGDGSGSESLQPGTGGSSAAATPAASGPGEGAGSAAAPAGSGAGAAAAAGEEDSDAEGSSSECMYLTAVVAEPCMSAGGTLVVDIHPWCAGHRGHASAPCSRVLQQLRDARVSWWATSTGANLLVTHQRELEALYRWAGAQLCGAGLCGAVWGRAV